jgi:hypothetical protein
VTFLLGALFFFCGSGAAQTVPHVTGVFKTPGNQTPQAAGLRSIATIGATAVYGSIDFQPYDSSGNKPTRILCGGVTYIPQKVRAWIKGDGTLVDNATGAAGVDLVPTQGCTPAGLVMRATVTLAPSDDGRIASVTWTEDKSLPQQASVDWGSLAAAGITAPTYTGYATIENGGVALPARNILNFLGGGCTDNTSTLATDCPTGGGGGGATIQTNGVSNTSQAVLNFQNSSKIAFSNPSSGNEQATIVAGSIQDADLAGSISPSKISGTAETQSNKNAASGYAGLDAGGRIAKAQLPAAAVFTDQTNSYAAGTKQSVASSATTAGFNLASLPGQPSAPASGDLNNNAGFLELYNGTAWKRLAYTDSNITGTAAALAANGTNCGAMLFAKGVDASGNAECAQPAFSDLSGSASAAQMLGLTSAHIYVGNGSNQPADVALSGDASLANTGAITVAKVNGTSVPTNAAADQAIVTTAAATGAWKSLPACSNATTDKLMYDTATHAFSCGTDQTGAAGGGITTLNTLTATTQTFAKTDDANVTLSITSSASTHTFAMGWTGQLANTRGGTGVNSSAATGVPRVNAGTWTFDAKTVNLADFSSTAPTTDGKIPIWNQTAQQYQPGDPVVSWNNGTAQTAAWTSATAVDSAVTASLTSPVNMSLVIVTLRATSTMTGGTLNFEADDGSGNFSFPIACDRLDTATVETTFALSATNKAWQCNIAGMSQFRVRLNPAIAGTGTANIRVTPSTAPVEAQVTVQQASGANLHVNVDSAPTTAVTGTFWQSTQPVSAASLPLPAGAATETTLSTLNGKFNAEITADYDTGAGTQTMKLFGLALPASGGAVAGGTATSPIRIDPTGTTTQPVSWSGQSVTVTQGTGTNLHMVCDSGCSGSGSTTPADAFANPTTAGLSFSLLGGFNGTTWDRLRVDGSKNLLIGLNAVGGASFAQGQRTMANSISTVPASDYTPTATPFLNGAVTTAVTVKGSSGFLYSWFLYNPNASVCYLQVFNTTTPTLGTTVPILSLPVPATSGANIPPGSLATAFNTAISVAATTTPTGSTTCTTGMTVNLWYQ